MDGFTFMIAAVFLAGLCFGSFLNVCIVRIPEGRSIVRPGSHCPRCGKPVRWYDNIPILGYILLKGRCRDCHSPISFRYLLVELATGVLSVGLFVKFGFSFEFPVYFIFIATLLVISFIDMDHYIIPDIISLPGIVFFFGLSLLLPSPTFVEALEGIALGGGGLWVIAFLYQRTTGKEGMGGGDVKLLAMIGALLGWKGVVFTLFVAATIGAVSGIIAMLTAGGDLKMKLPFGPFLSLGAVIYIFVGVKIWSWYMNLA